jgi:hypothetical protein
MLAAVVPLTVGVPGVPGAPGCGSVPPPHGASLSVQFDGLPGPLAMKPKLTDTPGATVPFHDRLVTV